MHLIELKLAYIGDGSREWARKLMFDLALCPKLTGQVALYDDVARQPRVLARLGDRLIEKPGRACSVVNFCKHSW